MTTDYGLRRRRPNAVLILGAATIIVGLVAFAAWEVRDFLQRRAAAISLAGDWAINAAPCVELTAAQFKANGLKTPKGFEFEGVTMSRRYGHVNCAMLRSDGGRGFSTYPVCQFTGPGALHVVAENGEAWFDTGIGHPATVSTEGGRPRCVLGSKFRLENGRLTGG